MKPMEKYSRFIIVKPCELLLRSNKSKGWLVREFLKESLIEIAKKFPKAYFLYRIKEGSWTFDRNGYPYLYLAFKVKKENQDIKDGSVFLFDGHNIELFNWNGPNLIHNRKKIFK